MISIETQRLSLIPMRFSFVKGLIDQEPDVYTRNGLVHTDEWPSKETQGILPLILKKLEQDGDSVFTSWLFVDKLTHTILGDGGYKSPPDADGSVEVGYGIVEEHRRKGIATEAMKALVHYGLALESVNKIHANCLNTNIGSMKVLQSVGMTIVEQDNEMTYFEYKK